MVAQRLRLLRISRNEMLQAAAAAAMTALLGIGGMHKLGVVGLLVPLAVVLACILLLRPLFAVSLVVILVILCEGSSFGILTFTSRLYEAHKDLSILDVFVALAVFSVGFDLFRRRRPLLLPRPLVLPLVVLALAMVVGAVIGHAAGASVRFAIVSEYVLIYLLLVPIAVANLNLDRDKITRLLAVVMMLAIVKAVLGLIEVFGHLGPAIEGIATLSYYEPAPNWVIMIAVIFIFASVVTRAELPRWIWLSSPLLIACLIFSYRRSFWIGTALGVLLVLLLGISPAGRRLLVPVVLAIAAAVWILGSINFQQSQSQAPIVNRLASLSPSRLEANKEDRYRLDERANVLGEISAHPISGLGVTIPWAAAVQPLSVEHEEGRQYVHFAALWFWLKLGILGLFAYISFMAASMWLAWKTWRGSREPLLRAFGLASLCGMAGLIAMDTTASFTGVDPRFTVLFAVQVGLLAILAMTASMSGHSHALHGQARGSQSEMPLEC